MSWLDNGDKIASIIAAVIALVALGITVWEISRRRRDRPAESAAPAGVEAPEQQSAQAGQGSFPTAAAVSAAAGTAVGAVGLIVGYLAWIFPR